MSKVRKLIPRPCRHSRQVEKGEGRKVPLIFSSLFFRVSACDKEEARTRQKPT